LSADIIKFDCFVTRNKTVVAYIMPTVSDTANIKFKHDVKAYVDPEVKLAACIDRLFSNEVEL
jgi:hypothetical protein